MGTEVEMDVDRVEADRERGFAGEAAREDVRECVGVGEREASAGAAEEKSERGLRYLRSWKGGLRTLKYMLKDRKARLACGTYLRGHTHFKV